MAQDYEALLKQIFQQTFTSVTGGYGRSVRARI